MEGTQLPGFLIPKLQSLPSTVSGLWFITSDNLAAFQYNGIYGLWFIVSGLWFITSDNLAAFQCNGIFVGCKSQ